MKKLKKCKGINKAFGFEGCGKEVLAQSRQYGLCQECIREWIKKTEEGKEYLTSTIIPKAKKEVAKEQKEAEKRQKDLLTDYAKKLQDRVNEIVRLIDIGLPCLARNYHPNQIHAGHIYSRGSNSSIKFNLHNIHRQSAQSNHYQNEDGLLREGLVNEYGVEYMEFISALRKTPSLKYSNLEYKEFYKTACGIANELKKDGRTFHHTEARIAMRNEVNKLLGIYESEFCTYEG